MKLENLTYQGPAIDDVELLGSLPANVAELLKQINGFIQYHGGFHFFGACTEPKWHSLREVWQGEHAAHRHYESISEKDVPFGEDCLGFQFLLRNGKVIRLDGETGRVESLEAGLGEFFEWVESNPVEHLGMQPLLQSIQSGATPEPGELVSEYPPFCVEEASGGVKLSVVPGMERRQFLVDIYRQLSELGEGETFKLKVVE